MAQQPGLVLLVGVISGVLFQFVSMLYYLNGRWPTVSGRKKTATVLGGGLAAMLVGLWVLSSQEEVIAYRLWFFQSLAGLAGFTFLDEARQGFMALVKRALHPQAAQGLGRGE